MSFSLSRRGLMVGLGSTAVVPAGFHALVKAETSGMQGALSVAMPKEVPGTPKLAAPLDVGCITNQSMRAIKQVGVDYVLMGGPPMPRTQAQLPANVDQCKSGGLVVGNIMISGFPNTIYGRPGRDKEVETFSGVDSRGGEGGGAND